MTLLLVSLAVAHEGAGFPFTLFRSYHEVIPTSESPADTGGSMGIDSPDWVIAPADRVEGGRVTATYTVGPEGIVEGGGLKLTLGHLLPTRQRLYTPFSLTATSAYYFGIRPLDEVRVTSSRPGVRVKVEPPRPGRAFRQQLQYVRYKRSDGKGVRDSLLRQIDNELAVVLTVRGAALQPGDTLRIEIGGRKGVPPPKSEASWDLVARVDGDGDGVYGYMPDPPGFDAYSADTVRIVAVAPTNLVVGETRRMVLRAEDGYFLPNLTRFGRAEVRFEPVEGLTVPPLVVMEGREGSWEGSVLEVPVTATAPGVHRLTGNAVVDGKVVQLVSNPVEVVPEGSPRIWWGDTHIHSVLSYDADRPPEYVWWRQRHQMGHDFAAISDHDMIGSVPFARRDGAAGRTEDEWAYMKQTANSWNRPGEFATIFAYEWTSYYFGHRNIYFADDEVDPPLFHHNKASDHPPYDEHNPGELRGELQGHRYIAIPHSTAWPTKAVQYAWGPGEKDPRYGDPALWPEQRVLELYSCHGARRSGRGCGRETPTPPPGCG